MGGDGHQPPNGVARNRGRPHVTVPTIGWPLDDRRRVGTPSNLLPRSSLLVSSTVSSPTASGCSENHSESPGPVWRAPRFWLAVFVIAFFVFSLYSGIVAYADLQTQNSIDTGIFTQALASTIHGHVAPYYESYDCMVKARCSFLLVHPGLVLYAAVPFYALVPSTLTLFALRAFCVATAAIPLYWLTRRITGSPWKGLLAAGLFLLWAPSFVGDAFSLHLESLLPLEMFSIAALWVAGRYRLALLVAVVSFLTLEVFPLFTFLLAAFFLFPYVEGPLRRQWRRWRWGESAGSTTPSILALTLDYGRSIWRVREVRYLLILMGASVAAYVALALFINVWGYEVLGVAAPIVGPGIGGVFANPSSPPAQPIGTILLSSQTVATAEYWLILYALVAFIPLLSPRALILSFPWIGWTFLTDSARFSTIGHQYSLVAAGPIFIGLAYGLQRVRWGRSDAVPADAGHSTPAATGDAERRRASWRSRRWPVGTLWMGALAIVVVANGILAPVNPLLPALGIVLGAPFEPDYFHHSLEIDPSFEWVEDLVSLIPTGATVGATSIVFPFVANYPDAYLLVAPTITNTTNLPFNLSGGPRYTLVTAGSLHSLYPSLVQNVSNPLVYGLRGYVASTYQGPVLLYEKGYTSTAESFGPGVPWIPATYGPGNGMNPGGRGVVVANSSALFGQVIQSVHAANGTGLVWNGPDLYLPSGNYTVMIRVMESGANLTVDPKGHALRIAIGGFGASPVNQTFLASSFTPGQWENLTFNFSLVSPLPEVNVQGYLPNDRFSVAMASVLIE
jgi:uncharacterized membrane protein